MNKNILGNRIKWVWTMKKLNTPLSVSSYPEGTKMGQRFFKLPAHISATWYDHGDLYFDEQEINLIREFLRYKIKNNQDYPDEIATQIYSLAKKIDQHNVAGFNNKKLKQLIIQFEKETKLFLQMIGFMSYRGSVQLSEILREQVETLLKYKLAEVNSLNSFQTYLDILSHPIHNSVIAEEKIFALQLAINFPKISSQEQKKRAGLYLKRFEWISYHWFIGTPPNHKQIIDRLSKLSVNSKQELLNMKKEQNKIENNIKMVVEKLAIKTKEKQLLKQYRSWLFLRTFVKDNINKAAFKLLPILHAIADAKKIDPKLIPFLTLDEIHNIERLTITKIYRLINERRNGFSAGIIENIFSFRTFNVESKPEQSTDEVQIKGSIAFKGAIKGVVKIVTSPDKQDKLKKGEILVASMTTPDLLPAMERAVAFITDEGGITCHAAIIAREMKKPCIIGTKIATKVLKDGDLVEVNAVEGVVKIIKRSNKKFY